MAKMRKLVTSGGTLDNIEADVGIFNLLSPKERKKTYLAAAYYASSMWAQKYVPLLFTNYVRRYRGYKLNGGEDRKPFVEDGDARSQVLRGSTIRVTGTSAGFTAKVGMPWPMYIMLGKYGAHNRRVIDQMPENEIKYWKEQFKKKFVELINANKRPAIKAGRSTLLLRQRN